MAIDKNFLETKTRDELRNMLSERGIRGMSKQNKTVLIQVLLNDMARTNGIPSKADLEGKTLAELRQMCTDKGMTGLNRQPKTILVELLLNEFARSVIQGVQGEFTVERTEEGHEKTITVSCGGSSDEFPVVGYSIQQVYNELKDTLNIPSNPLVNLNGSQTTNMAHILEEGDVLSFVQNANDKG